VIHRGLSIVHKNLFGSQPEDCFKKKMPKHVAGKIFKLSFNCIYILNVALDCKIIYIYIYIYSLTLDIQGADKSLARPGRKQATAKEDFDLHISYLCRSQ